MKQSTERLLGIFILVVGGLLLSVMLYQITMPQLSTAADNTTVADNHNGSQGITEQTQQPLQPLTADIETEQRILAQKKAEREQRVVAQEKQAAQYLKQQQQAEAMAMEKARVEQEKYRRNQNVIEPTEPIALEPIVTAKPTQAPQQTQSAVTATPLPNTANEQAAIVVQQQAVAQQQQAIQKLQQDRRIAVLKNTQGYRVRRGDTLNQLAQQYGVSVATLAKTNQLAENSDLLIGQTIQVPAKGTVVDNDASIPELKNLVDYKVKRGDALIKLAQQYGVSVAALAKANNLPTTVQLRVGETIKVPKTAQPSTATHAQLQAKREAEKQARQRELDRIKGDIEKSKAALQAAQNRLKQARVAAIMDDAKGKFGVQVALANNQAMANTLVKKFQAAGYTNIKTSTTSRGVRVLIGPEQGKQAALALKDKINSDPKVNTKNAWVLYWR